MVDPDTATHSLRIGPLGNSLSLLLFTSYLLYGRYQISGAQARNAAL